MASSLNDPRTPVETLLAGQIEDAVWVDEAPSDERAPRRFGLLSALAVLAMIAILAGGAIYANLSFAVTNPADYRYFPPFKAVNANNNDHLGAEYFCIAKSLVAGEGFSSPFREKTGPTAWMPPILAAVLAGLLVLCDGNQNLVMTLVIIAQTGTLILTGVLVVTLAWKTTQRLPVAVAAGLFLVGVMGDFHLWYQQTHDCWIILLAMNLVLAGYCWAAPLTSGWRAAGWGVCGGIVALTSPIAAFAWGILCMASMAHQRAWKRGAIALLAAALTISPWMVRNYLVFGRLIPIKSNANYELWQSQCLTTDGLLQTSVFGGHPWSSGGRERQQYKEMGELAFLDRKGELFWASVRADPLEFLDRIACRGLGATLWYLPGDRAEAQRRPWVLWISRLLHPLPFLALLFLVATAFLRPLHPAQWFGIGLYLLYLTPYIGVSYYDRYAMPLLAVKMLLVIWGADRLLSLLRPARPAVA
jgi:hypothetical protein